MVWKSAREVYGANLTLFPKDDEFKPRSIVGGRVTNGYFLSVVDALILTEPESIKNLFVD